uniref:Uncharacterized protein n=1 Tax=Octopus bimaculoides TaxID=37653 RepID=A0A0L8H6H3_OCTBM
MQIISKKVLLCLSFLLNQSILQGVGSSTTTVHISQAHFVLLTPLKSSLLILTDVYPL